MHSREKNQQLIYYIKRKGTNGRIKPVFRFFYQQQGLRERRAREKSFLSAEFRRHRSRTASVTVAAQRTGTSHARGHAQETATWPCVIPLTPYSKESIRFGVVRGIIFFRYYVLFFFEPIFLHPSRALQTKRALRLHLDSPTWCDILGRAPVARKQPLDIPASRLSLVSRHAPLFSHCTIY